MNSKKSIEKAKEYVKENLLVGDSGHDWQHTLRVYTLAKKIAKKENANLFVVELGALFHDIADSKFTGGDESIATTKTKEYLNSLNLDSKIINEVIFIIENISFKKEQPIEKSLELKVVQDADRLDAIGAIGIARAFSYGGYKSRPIYDPNQEPNLNLTKEEYRSGNGSTINHFYEKLLLLKDLMNTKEGQKIAQKRHQFLEKYLIQFFKELNGKS